MPNDIKIHPAWYSVLEKEFEKPYFHALKQFIREEKKAGKTIYPPGPLIFNAFERSPLDQVKVIILGQDPYHGPGQAMGLSFSVPRGIEQPASLKNIFKELKSDMNINPPNHGDLSSWAGQGVFLLNSILTVEKSLPGSHQKSGWQTFTDAVISILSESKKGLIFLLWGNFARNKKILIDETKHYILEAAHPSPLAGGAFFGCKHFSKTNDLLIKNELKAIEWKIENY